MDGRKLPSRWWLINLRRPKRGDKARDKGTRLARSTSPEMMDANARK
jgi:hypothetical protein